MKIYTRTGDGGETALLGGARVSKADPRVAAYGDVDELNAWLGFVLAGGVDGAIAGALEPIQRDLFAIGARLADPSGRVANRVEKPPLRRFILPGGSASGAALHVARTVCRRAERTIVGLGADHVEPEILEYLNRLSDLLFVMARTANHRDRAPEVEW